MQTLYDELINHQKNKKDKRKFGLVLPGGGMRAVYSAGAVSTLLQYNLENSFDHVIGVSAGAIHGAYFLADDNETMKNTYPDDLTNKNFVNLMRLDKKVDIDYLIDMVLKHKHPINLQKLKESTSKFHIVMTDAKNGKKVVISDHKAFVEIYEELRATSALPLLYDKTVLVGSRYYVDGAVSDNLPIDVAIELGCTDVVVVMTKKITDYTFGKHHQRLVKHLVKKFAKNQSLQVRRKLPTDEKVLRLNLRRLSNPTKKLRFYILEPSNSDLLVGLGSIDKPKIEALGSLGASDMDRMLNTAP